MTANAASNAWTGRDRRSPRMLKKEKAADNLNACFQNMDVNYVFSDIGSNDREVCHGKSRGTCDDDDTSAATKT